ncbi:hypothetical protein JCM6882_005411 [Rhodosporidiobolus microsporus]
MSHHEDQHDPSSRDLTLAQLLTRSLTSADALLSHLSPNDPSAQTLLTRTLGDLTLAAKLIDHLGVLSPNETLDDIATRDLRCLLVDALQGQLCVLVRTKGGEERLKWLQRAQTHFQTYLRLVALYGAIPATQQGAITGPAAGEMDSSRRRAGKIAQFKMEREIKGTLEELRTRRRRTRIRSTAPVAASSSSSTSSSSSAPTPTPADDDENVDFLSDDDDDQADDIARPLLLSLLTLHALRAHAELGSMEQEIELLEHGMKMTELSSGGKSGRDLEKAVRDARERVKNGEGAEEEEARWRLDRLSVEDGPVLSPEGKILRPFTILPSSSSASSQTPMGTRLRLQSEVFRPSHRLPTMSIDEYLALEQERGNVLQGGNGPSTSEGVEQAKREEREDVEQEDTVRGYESEERGLRKKREEDEWRDTHRKGEGNMYNRG